MRLKVALAVGSTLASLLLVTLLVELALGSSFPRPPIYAMTDGHIGPARDVHTQGRLGTRSYSIALDAQGLRQPVPASPSWVVVGDSFAFGLGVEGDQALPAALTRHGVPSVNAGLPSFTVPDALRRAEGLLASTKVCGVLLVVNASDDVQPLDVTVDSQFVTAGPWLLSAGSPDWSRSFFASRWSHVQLPHLMAMALGQARGQPNHDARPLWVQQPDGGAALSRALGERVQAFARNHPDVSVVVAWAPLDADTVPDRPEPSAYERLRARTGATWSDDAAVAGLRDGLGAVPFVDLGATFDHKPELYLAGDLHASAAGHEAMAAALVPVLQECRP